MFEFSLGGNWCFEPLEKDSSMKKTTALLAVLATVFSLGLAACNTVEGVGEDVRSAGDAIDDAAEDANN